MNRCYKLKKDSIELLQNEPAILFKTDSPTTPLNTDLIDLRSKMPPVYDQGSLGSCTANALAGAYEYDQIKQNLKPFVPSRLFIYYHERKLEGTVHEDSGAQISTGVKVLSHIGVVPESEWGYNIHKFTVAPPHTCEVNAKNHKVTQYYRITSNSIDQVKQALLNHYTVVFGIQVYQSFESDEVATTGVVSLPVEDEQYLGGHAVLIVGFNDINQTFIVRNSWGSSWGQSGYFTLPYAYISNSNLSMDFWCIETVHDSTVKRKTHIVHTTVKELANIKS